MKDQAVAPIALVAAGYSSPFASTAIAIASDEAARCTRATGSTRQQLGCDARGDR